MTQSPAIITGTVKENLTYINKNSELSDSMLWAALDNVNLKQTFLDRDGLETKISENAINLSMGQKQRLALARLFLADYHLIVLDEFSNGIDYESKALIISSINKAVKNKICISISHDKDVISTADEIIDFSKDKIEEFTKTKC